MMLFEGARVTAEQSDDSATATGHHPEAAPQQRGHVATCGRVDAVAGPGSYRSFVG